jgi:hypothetical protein
MEEKKSEKRKKSRQIKRRVLLLFISGNRPQEHMQTAPLTSPGNEVD